MKRSFDSGSSPLELVAFTTLLVLPIGLAIGLYQQLSNELAAESIARHALRLAMLSSPQRPSESLDRAVNRFADSWDVAEVEYSYWCSHGCSLVTLEVQVGQAFAIQTMGLPRT
jgi:hypothetical protein